ncbi:TetR/AcrR family transcriptional regulator [Phenylobacterium sp.]|uniref:TetR/AcrR family transcriptional regulator n=1 Tax=Phenylobacterium sp. TaxID=1871053 RepID=UPI0035B372D7
MTRRAPIKVNLEARAANAELRRRQTRAKLLDAALEVIAEKGPEAASIEDYAAAAGVARGTVYNYFPTAADLLDGVRRLILRRATQSVQTALDGVDDPAGRLAGLCLSLIIYAGRNPTDAWAALRLERLRPTRSPDDPDVFDQAITDGLARGRFRRVDPRSARTLVTGAVRMAIHDVLTLTAPANHAVGVTALILAGLGLAAGEAEALTAEIARRAAD